MQTPWALQGHTDLPQPNSKIEFAEWKKSYDEALGSIEELPANCGSIIFKGKE